MQVASIVDAHEDNIPAVPARELLLSIFEHVTCLMFCGASLRHFNIVLRIKKTRACDENGPSGLTATF